MESINKSAESLKETKVYPHKLGEHNLKVRARKVHELHIAPHKIVKE